MCPALHSKPMVRHGQEENVSASLFTKKCPGQRTQMYSLEFRTSMDVKRLSYVSMSFTRSRNVVHVVIGDRINFRDET